MALSNLSNNLSAERPDIILEFEACLAEYNAVREELRDRAEAHRIVTRYGLLALSAVVTIASLVLGGFTTEQQAIVPIHYLLLVIPALFLYLISVYADESLAEYIAQTYIIHVLRPNMKKICNYLAKLRLKPTSNGTQIHADFHR